MLSNIYEENVSLDTIGNAYFFRVIHLNFLLSSHTSFKVLIITSDFHLARTKAVFDHVLSLDNKVVEVVAGSK